MFISIKFCEFIADYLMMTNSIKKVSKNSPEQDFGFILVWDGLI